MATVTGKTSSEIDTLLGPTIVGANLDGQGALTFQRKNGGVIQAGSLGSAVVSATINGAKHLIFTTMQGGTVDAGSIDSSTPPLAAWPVGSVYLGMTSANPSTLLGGGTWARLAKGRMLMGVDEGDTNFDAVRETGGSKSKTLTPVNLPPHAHGMAHEHLIRSRDSANGDGGGAQTSAVASAGGTGALRENNSAVAGSSAATTGPGPGTTAPFDVMNPYITVYIWERTA